MNINWNTKNITYAVLAVLLLLASVRAGIGAHKVGSGLAFFSWMDQMGYTIEDYQALSETHKNVVRRDTSAQAIPYAAFILIAWLLAGMLVIMATAYTFRQRWFSRRNTLLSAVGLCLLFGLASATAASMLPHSSRGAIAGGIGMAVVLFILFYLLVGILAGARKVTLSLLSS